MKKLITKIMLLLGVFTLLGAGQSYAATVYFLDTDGWGTANCYSWTNNSPSWPGPSMDKVKIDGQEFYSYTTTDTNMIFNNNNNGKQTCNLEVVDGGVYCALLSPNNNNGWVKPYGKIVNNKFTMYDGVGCYAIPVESYNINSGLCFYTWNPTITQDWPGTEMFKQVIGNVNYWLYVGNYSNMNNTFDGFTLTQKDKNGENKHDKKITLKSGDIITIIDGVKGNIFENTSSNDPLAGTHYAVKGKIFHHPNVWEKYYMTETADGKWVLKDVYVADGEFGIQRLTDGNEDNGYFYGPQNETDQIFVIGTTKKSSTSNEGNFKLNAYGLYTFIFDPTTGALTVKGKVDKYATSDIYLNGLESWDANNKYRFTNVDGNEYYLIVSSEGLKEFKVYDVPTDTWYGSTSSTELQPSIISTLNTSGDNLSFDFKKNKFYKVTFWKNRNNKGPAIQITDPDKLYLFGHISDGWWELGNYAELALEDGKYQAVVEFGGCWSYFDVDNFKEMNRSQYGSTEGENYFALFPTNKPLGFYNGSGAWKFGSKTSENDHGASSNKNNDLGIGAGKSLVWQEEKESNNFVIENGTYKVIVDLENGTIDLQPAEPEDKVYVWYAGAGNSYKEVDLIDNTNDDGYAHYEFTLGDNNPDIVQVGIDTRPSHKLARQVEYTVWYKGNATIDNTSHSTKAQVKRRANDGSLAVNEEHITQDDINTKYPGYTLATPSIVDASGKVALMGHYTLYGSSDNSDNHTIQLNKAGEYIISATPVEDAVLNGSLYNLTTSSMFATVHGSAVTVTIGTYNDGKDNNSEKNVIRAAFDTDGTNVFPGIINIDNTDFDAEDIAFNITKKSTGATWAASTATGEDLKQAYEDAFVATAPLSTLYEQLISLDTQYVDGFFTTVSATAGESTSNETPADGTQEFDFILKAPCSGVYIVELSSTNDEYGLVDANGLTPSFEVTIYPNLVGTFGKDNGFNVNGFTFQNSDTNHDKTIEIDPTFIAQNNMRYSACFIPGTYFADSFTVDAQLNSEPASAKRQATTNGVADASHYQSNIDLSAFNSDSKASYTLTASIEKNGASADYIFTVKSGTNINVSTGVETIGEAEDGEAVYFNLQGVKVTNPDKGIYVKVQNGKASKVVL